jgi:hypothetical protein
VIIISMPGWAPAWCQTIFTNEHEFYALPPGKLFGRPEVGLFSSRLMNKSPKPVSSRLSSGNVICPELIT